MNSSSADTTSRDGRLGHIPALDGMRGLSVLAVVAFHFKWPGGANGYYGVDVFFVLSGFLIWTLLSNEAQRGQISLRRFFTRRGARLLPASWAVLAAATIPSILGLYPNRALCVRQGAAALLYVHNFQTKLDSGLCGPIQHYWSLAVEEQFYLFAPVALWVVLRCKRQVTFRAVATILAAVLAWNLFGAPALPKRIASAAELPYGGLLVGVLASIAYQSRRLVPRAPAIAGGVALVVCLVGPSIWTQHNDVRLLIQLGLHLSVAVVILHLAQFAPHVRVLSGPVLQWLGTRSYGIYLIHLPIQGYISRAGLDNSVVYAVATAIAAELSFRFLETPIRQLVAKRTAGSIGTDERIPAVVPIV